MGPRRGPPAFAATARSLSDPSSGRMAGPRLPPSKPRGRPSATEQTERIALEPELKEALLQLAERYDRNEKRLPKKSLKAFDGAVDEYFAALKRRVQ
jgi:hypothetical protein